jgi:hypothetical protein
MVNKRDARLTRPYRECGRIVQHVHAMLRIRAAPSTCVRASVEQSMFRWCPVGVPFVSLNPMPRKCELLLGVPGAPARAMNYCVEDPGAATHPRNINGWIMNLGISFLTSAPARS